MSVIAHWIEQQGISTIVIGLVKNHLQKINPPRALWVPFELGRPLGPPSNPAFQQHVLTTALDMTSQSLSGPVLMDYDSDDPRSVADVNWQPPVSGRFDSVTTEVNALDAAFHQFKVEHKRTATGVSGVSITDCAKLIDSLGDEPPADSLRADISPILMVRYAIDDLKAYYIEAALADGTASSQQVHDWFWLQSYLGAELKRLRQLWMKSNNGKLKALGERFLIPHHWRTPV